MVLHAARALERLCEHVVIVSSRPETTAGEYVRIPDLRTPPVGPLGGIEAALAESKSRGLHGVFVLAADMPLIGSAPLEAIVEAARREAGFHCAVARREGDPPLEPLCGVYPQSAYRVVAKLLDNGERAAHLLARALDSVIVDLEPHGPAEALTNVNTEADLARVRRATS